MNTIDITARRTCPEWCIESHTDETYPEILHSTAIVSTVDLDESPDQGRLEVVIRQYMDRKPEADVYLRDGASMDAFTVTPNTARALAGELLRIADELDRMTGQ